MSYGQLPSCRKCNARIQFVKILSWKPFERGDRPVQFVTTLPVDIDPSPAGTITLFTWPKPLPGSGLPSIPGVPVRTVGRRLTPAEIGLYTGGVLYRVHFDTCAANRGRSV